MVRSRLRSSRQRTALLLYALLVVLPAVVFGSLLWAEQARGHEQELAGVPARVREAGARLTRAIRLAVDELLATEAERSPLAGLPRSGRIAEGSRRFYESASPLKTLPRPEGVEAWFHFDPSDIDSERLTIHHGAQGPPFGRGLEVERNLLARYLSPGELEEDPGGVDGGPALSAVHSTAFTLELAEFAAALHSTSGEDGIPTCAFDDIRQAGSRLQLSTIELRASPFTLRLVEDASGKIGILATRRIWRQGLDLHPAVESESFWRCLSFLGQDQTWTQGLLIDGDFVLQTLPRRFAQQVLGPDLAMADRGDSKAFAGDDWIVTEVAPLQELGVLCDPPESVAWFRLRVGTSRAALIERIGQRTRWYLAVVLVLSLSVGVGLFLGLRALQASERYARRTENFVAAVTHELRTPIAAVRMYGEMLRDGWIQEPKRQAEYLSRILSETGRLNILVSRVLDKRRLEEAPPEPEIGDLLALVREAFADAGYDEATDVALDAEGGPLRALLVPVGVRAVVTNLVENARKYAPVPAAGEPILVRLRRTPSGILLEVLDRGPGIAVGDRERALQPFVRLGDEKTRRAPGTGLGLHLVLQFCQAMKATLELLDREGGGLLVRIRFRAGQQDPA